MKHHLAARASALTLVALATLSPLAVGQEASASAPSAGPALSLPPSFCDRWKKMGTLYKNAENPYVQEFKFFGRLHYQYGTLDGDAATQPNAPSERFHYDTDQIRRFRVGVGGKFLDNFDLYAEAEIGDDKRPRGGDFNVRFQHMWQLKVHYDLKKAYGIDELDMLKLGVGSREINMSYEWVTSSKRIKTVERSAIANKIWAYNTEFANPTGVWTEFGLDPIEWTFGVFSTTQDDWIAPFDDGELYYTKMKWDLDKTEDSDTDMRLAAFYQDVEQGEEALAGGLSWATALSVQHKTGPWELHLEGITGDNGDTTATGGAKNADRQGDFWGVVFMPSYWIFEDSLELAFQVQYQGASEREGIRLNSRYARRAGVRDGIPSLVNGRGDEQWTYYVGLNKLLCGHQQKVMIGVEYDTLSSQGDDVYRGWTAFVAYRTYW